MRKKGIKRRKIKNALLKCSAYAAAIVGFFSACAAGGGSHIGWLVLMGCIVYLSIFVSVNDWVFDREYNEDW